MNEWITRAHAFLDQAFENQLGRSKECIEIQLSAHEQSSPIWDRSVNRSRYSELRKKYPGSRGLPKTLLKPLVDLRGSLYEKEALLAINQQMGKAYAFKASLYDSTKYEKVVVFLVSNHRIAKENWIHNRIDVIFNEGEIMMGNTSQIICAACSGASPITGVDCKCEYDGFHNPPINDVGITGDVLAVTRYIEPTAKYLRIYNAEC